MNVLLDILKNYWKEILSALLVIISVIIALIRKKPVNDIISYIYEFCVEGVKEAENANYVSTDLIPKSLSKQSYAIDFVKKNIRFYFPNIDVNKYDFFIVKIIEDILSTPQKKG